MPQRSARLTQSGFLVVTDALAKAMASAVAAAGATYAGMSIGAFTGSPISPFWPASGVATAAVLVWGWPALPGIYAGMVALNVLAGVISPFAWAGPFGLVAECSLAAVLARFVQGRHPDPASLRGVLSIVLGAAWLPPLVNGAAFAKWFDVSENSAFLASPPELARFVLANGFGIALIAPALLVWKGPQEHNWWRRFALSSAGCIAAGWLVFRSDAPDFLLVVPLLVAAVATGLRGAAVLTALSAFATVLLSAAGHGPFAAGIREDDYSSLYGFFAALAFGVMPVGAVCGEHRRALRQRRSAEKAAGLRFWEWNRREGARIDESTEQPERLFDPDLAKDRGSLETKLAGRDVLSFWQTLSRHADGRPREVAGVLVDASERLVLEETRRRSWQSEIELRNLRAGLTPHLLFNCLAAVRGVVRSDPDKARAFIDQLSRFLRESTNAQARSTIPLLDEWQLCEDFLALQALRYERELPRLADIEGPAHHAHLPPMMLLNLVENAVKHGEISQQHPLRLRVRLHDGMLEATVRNHGQLGTPADDRPGGLGVARARLQAVYGDSASLDIRQEGAEVTAILRIPAEDPPRTTPPFRKHAST